MSQITFRANLSAQAFPFLSYNQGRTIVIKQYDQNYVPTVTPKEDTDKDIGIPQLYYCHNVMPFAHGFQSIGYRDKTLPISVDETKIFQTIPLRKTEGNKTAFLGICSDGRFYVSNYPFSDWNLVTTLSNTSGRRLTYAHINGETYIYVAKKGCYKFNFDLQTLEEVTLTGLITTDIIGIVSSEGYLIAYSESAVFWSSTIDPLDFTPSQVTGAGGGQVQEIKGTIVVCSQSLSGFYIYATGNIVVAIASGNSRYPFNFRALAGSGGLASADMVAVSETVSSQYAYTSVGFNQITPIESKVVLPELTDFIAGSVFEDFNESTNTLSIVNLGETVMKKKLSLIVSRYLVISYGISELTHALVLDLSLRRWGKLKLTHVDCFELSLLTPESTETPKDSLAFLQKDGTVKTVEFSSLYTESNGVILLGKYQLHRARKIQLDEVAIENCPIEASFSLIALVSQDGANISSQVSGYLHTLLNNFRRYFFRVTGTNISLLCKGAFSISSLVLTVNNHGKR